MTKATSLQLKLPMSTELMAVCGSWGLGLIRWLAESLQPGLGENEAGNTTAPVGRGGREQAARTLCGGVRLAC